MKLIAKMPMRHVDDRDKFVVMYREDYATYSKYIIWREQNGERYWGDYFHFTTGADANPTEEAVAYSQACDRFLYLCNWYHDYLDAKSA